MSAGTRPSRDVQRKAAQYLAAGRLVVTRVDGDHVEAQARGAMQWYRCGYSDSRGGWWCTCESRSTCSHLAALMRVVVQPWRMREAGYE